MRSFALACLWLLVAATAAAEPHFLTKQYSRCATCHYRPSGGGLLTPYGRMLSQEELSTLGRTPPDEDPGEGAQEYSFLYGVLGPRIGETVDLGIDLRPSRIRLDFGRGAFNRDFWMRADLEVAVRHNGFTGYAEIGRLPTTEPELISREHWLGWQGDEWGFRVGRFLPAFGVNVADHTWFNRRELGFDQHDQIYGAELSVSHERLLMQLFAGPGRAESIIDDDGGQAWTYGGRAQFDLANRNVLALSGLYRAENDFDPQSWVGSVAYGWAPTSRLSLWTEADARISEGFRGTAEYVVFHQTSFEVTRGLWLEFSPQIITELGNDAGGTSRLAVGFQFMPRTHWDVNVTWIRDRQRTTGLVSKSLVLQLHLYL